MKWLDNSIQYPRLLAEINAVGLTESQLDDLCESTDLTKPQIQELLDRAERDFEALKLETHS